MINERYDVMSGMWLYWVQCAKCGRKGPDNGSDTYALCDAIDNRWFVALNPKRLLCPYCSKEENK